MNRFPALLLLSLVLILSSCKNDDLEEQMVPQALLGLWEATYYNDYIELDYVTAYNFHQDGTYVHSSTLRERNGSQDLGYNFRSTGTYRVEGNKIILTLTEHLHKPFGGGKMFYQVNELDRGHVVEGHSQGSMNFEIRNEGQELFLPGGLIGGAIQADQSLIRVN